MAKRDTQVEDARIVGAKNNFVLYMAGAVIILIVALLSSCFYSVETEESAVVLRLGKFSSIETSGLHFKLPFGIDEVFFVKTERIFKEEFGFRTAGGNGSRTSYSNNDFKDESLVLTGDLNVSDLEWIVQYQVNDPYKYLFTIKDPVSTIRDVSEAATRKIIGNANVSDVLTTERAALADVIHKEIQKTLDSYNIGVHIVTYKFQDVNPPESVKTAFNSVNEAEQQRESLIQKAREQYNNQVPKARGEAKRMIQSAEGYALERVNKAQGEASRFLAVLTEYKKYPLVTRTRLYLETMEKVLPKLKDIYIVDGQNVSDTVTPLLPLSSFNDITVKTANPGKNSAK